MSYSQQGQYQAGFPIGAPMPPFMAQPQLQAQPPPYPPCPAGQFFHGFSQPPPAFGWNNSNMQNMMEFRPPNVQPLMGSMGCPPQFTGMMHGQLQQQQQYGFRPPNPPPLGHPQPPQIPQFNCQQGFIGQHQHMQQLQFQQQPGATNFRPVGASFKHGGGGGGGQRGRGGKRSFSGQNHKSAKKQRKEKEILSKGHKITGEVKVREPANEEERQELEQWIQDRKKNWPFKQNLERKKEKLESQGGVHGQFSDKLIEVLKKQQELGLAGKAGTEDLLDTVLNTSSNSAGNRRGGFTGRGGPGRGRLGGRGRGRQTNRNSFQQGRSKRGGFGKNAKFDVNKVRKFLQEQNGSSLYRKLVEDDVRNDREKILQVLKFIRLNNFFENVGNDEIVFPKNSSEEIQQDDKQKIREALVYDAAEDSDIDEDSAQNVLESGDIEVGDNHADDDENSGHGTVENLDSTDNQINID